MDTLPPALSALGAYPQFIVYVLVPRPGLPGKTDKFPVDYKSGKPKINAHDPQYQTDFHTAATSAALLGHAHGIGFVLTPADPFFCIDIDSCLSEETATWLPHVQELISMVPGAAVEVSSSGRGIHVIGSAACPPHSCRNDDINTELYSEGRFIALTGAQTSGDVRTDCNATIPNVINKYFPERPMLGISNWTTVPVPEWRGPTDDDELIRRALQSRSGLAQFDGGRATFHDLWMGNVEILSMAYPPNDVDAYNRSNADAALAQHLVFWTGANCERIERLMHKSSLVRDKWTREGYLRTTILRAVALRSKVLVDAVVDTPAGVAPSGAEIRPERRLGASLLGVEQQIELFAGCVYIRDAHCVLVPGGQLIKPEQFKAWYGGYNFVMDVENVKVSDDAWKAFTNSRAIRAPQASGSCFKPDLAPGEFVTESDGRTLANIFWPITVRRVVGDVSPFLEFTKKILPDDNDRLILLSFMAACVQHQGKKFQWCPLIQGTEGNGKTLLARCVEYAVGHRYSHFPKAAEIASRFNDWMYGNIFIGVDDIYLADSKTEVLEALKPMIDRDRLEIEPKNGVKTMRDVCGNFILNSNHRDAIRKTRDGRRYAVFYSAQQKYEDLKRDGMTDLYFPNLYDWLRKDGFAIVAEFLFTFNIPDYYNPAKYCKRAPDTSSTESAISEGHGVIEQEILEAIAQDEVGFRGGWVSTGYLEMYLEKRNLARRCPPNRRREILQSLGYDWHPALDQGRVNNIVFPDGKKPRLFIKNGHGDRAIDTAAGVARAYTEAQSENEK